MTLETLPSNEARIQQAIEFFTQVRNIPYRLGLNGDPNKLISEGVGNCTRKHLYLQPRLKQLGYKVDIGIAIFDWRELPIPDEVISLLNDPIQRHMFLFVNDQPIDATWPPGIPDFPVIEWDGINATELGVSAQKIIKPNLLILQARSIASLTINAFRTITANEQSTLFNDAFNSWLERVQG